MGCYSLRKTGISYTRAREVVLDAFSQLGFPSKLFGLHSLRSGGATVAANAGVNDRLFKHHGRWRSDTEAKDGYVKDHDLDVLLSVSKRRRRRTLFKRQGRYLAYRS